MPTALVSLLPVFLLGALLLPVTRSPVLAVAVEGDLLQVRLGIWDKIYCFRRNFAVPVGDVEGAAVAPRHLVPTRGMRLPGTGIPGVIRAGSFGSGPNRDFWDVRKAEMLLVIELRHGAEYRRIVLQVADPAAVSRELRPLLGAFTGAFL